MLIDRTHRPWAIATAVTLGAAAAAYVPYATASVTGAQGGTIVGLAYGVAGFAMMLFAGLLSVRKKFPIWRIGRAKSWMRGHLWLGALSFPIILFHSGFAFGGGITLVLMWLFVVVFVSGVAGAALQHVLPRLMLERVPMETIYEQIPHVRLQLVDESDAIVAQASGALDVAVAAAPTVDLAASLATVVRVDADPGAPLREFYLKEMRPFVVDPERPHALADANQAASRFAQLRTVLPSSFQGALDDLANICEEERQLQRQLRMHRVLHGWLLVHIPLSFALLALSIAHIVMALKY